MPGKVKVKIVAGRNLPVMDRGSDTTDAYVEIKLGGVTQKTDVCRKSLHPRWNTDWFRFEMDDHELQDEPLQIRLMDYDTYSANDAIGKVNINLNPLLNSVLETVPGPSQKGTCFSAGKGTVISGWIPVFDTMNGIRGEVEILVKVDLVQDFNKFRQSSCGVQFFHSLNIPFGYHAPTIHGFVEELIVNDDPEYDWIDKIRTPRASNEARQVLFLKLSSQVQRKMGLKASEMGANAVIGYRLCLDLEGDVGVVARGIGTAVTLVKIPDSINSFTENALIEEPESNSSSTIIAEQRGLNSSANDETLPPTPAPTTPLRNAETTGEAKPVPIHSPTSNPPINIVPDTPENNSSICRRSSDSDLSVTPKGNSVTSCERGGTSMGPIIHRVPGHNHMKSTMNTLNLDMLEYPFLTLEKFPQGFIIHLGSCVCARSVKLLERVANPDEPETRDNFWTELRMEIRSHTRALGCNVVLGYSESTTISDEVCVLSATGTAAVINMQYIAELGLADSTGNLAATKMTSSLDRNDFERQGSTGGVGGATQTSATVVGGTSTTGNVLSGGGGAGGHPTVASTEGKGLNGKSDSDSLNGSGGGGMDSLSSSIGSCTVAHIPYNVSSVPFNVSMDTCAMCRKSKVPDVLVSTIEPPENLSITGRGCLLQAQVCRVKKDLRGESNAKEISDLLPFLEYELHRLLINKLKVRGMNAIFGLKSSLAVGEKLITLIATGTGVFVSALPPAVVPKVTKMWPDPEKIKDIQKKLRMTMEKNMELYQVSVVGEKRDLATDEVATSAAATARRDESDGSDEEGGQNGGGTNSIGDSMDLTLNNKDICVLEVDDIDDLEVLSLLLEPAAPEGFYIVNTQNVPGLGPLEPEWGGTQQQQYFVQVWRGKFTSTHMQSQFAKSLQALLHGIVYKLRTMAPCAISDLRFTVDLPDAEWVQVLITGIATMVDGSNKTKRKRLQSINRKESKKVDEELIFKLEDDNHHEMSASMTNLSPNLTAGGMPVKHQTSLPMTKYRNKSAPGMPNSNIKFPRPTFARSRFGVDITPMGYVPGARMDKYIGNLNFFFIRESTSIRESGGVSGFVHSFITEVLAVVRAHVTALGGNAMVAFYMTEMMLNESIHKNQGQCLISVGGDVVSLSYTTDD